MPSVDEIREAARIVDAVLKETHVKIGDIYVPRRVLKGRNPLLKYELEHRGLSIETLRKLANLHGLLVLGEE